MTGNVVLTLVFIQLLWTVLQPLMLSTNKPNQADLLSKCTFGFNFASEGLLVPDS